MMILWSFRRCPYAMRARLALKSSGVQVSLREIILRDKPHEFLAASPKGTVPVLVLQDGTVLEESLDIMLWALKQNDPEGWLDVMRKEPAYCSEFLERLDGEFKTQLDRYKYNARCQPLEAVKQRDLGAEFLCKLDEVLAEQPALSGARHGLLDYAALPFIRQFRGVDTEWFEAQEWGHLKAWLRAFLKSERFEQVMQKYQPWLETGGEGVEF